MRRRFVSLVLLRGIRPMRWEIILPGRDEAWPINFNRFLAPSSYNRWRIRLKIGLPEFYAFIILIYFTGMPNWILLIKV